MLVDLSLSSSNSFIHSFTHSCTSAIRDPPWSMIHDPITLQCLGGGCLWEWVSECDMGQGSSWWCDGGDGGDDDVEEEEEEATTLKENGWESERERERESSSWWMDGSSSSSAAVSVTLGFSMFGDDDDDGNDISCMCVCMCGSCVGLCVIQSLWLLSILIIMVIIIIIIIIIISSGGGSVIHSSHSFIHSTSCWYHSHPSAFHDPWPNHPPLPVCGCLKEREWVSVTWVKVRVDDRSINDVMVVVMMLMLRRTKGGNYIEGEWVNVWESVSHRVDRSMDGWMDHWWYLITIVTTRMKGLVRDLRIHDVARKEVRWRKS